MSEPRCPSCGSSTLSVERRPDGNARCALCGWSGKYAMCFNDQKTEVRISSEPRRWWVRVQNYDGNPVKRDRDRLCCDYEPEPQELEAFVEVIEAEPVLARIKELEAQLKEAEEHLALALSFAPKGPVPEGLAPMFYHTLEYESELKLQERIDAAREYLRKKTEERE